LSFDSVSIIMPTFNCAASLEESIKSVTRQTYQKWELVIVDDYSTDKTFTIAKRFETLDSRIRAIRLERNKGTGMARLAALQLCRYDWIAFLDSDDFWLPEKLERHLDHIRQNNLEFSYTSYFSRTVKSNRIRTVNVPEFLTYSDLLKSCPITTSTVIVSKEHLRTSMSDWRKRQDYITWLNILREGYMAVGLAVPLTTLNMHTSSISSNKFDVAKIQYKVYREALELSLPCALYYFLNYTVRGIVKYLKRRL